MFLIIISIVVGVCVYIYYNFGGDNNSYIILVIISGIVLPFITAYQCNNQLTEFEIRQRIAIKEIDYILREREQL